MPCKAIMYHYVRPQDSDLPHLRYLHIDDFRRQLDWLERQFGFVRKEDFLQALSGGPLPDGVVLTFDDGLADHHDYVLPELERRGLWGFFFVPTMPLKEQRMLSVHGVHMLLGRFGAARVAQHLRNIVHEDMLQKDRLEELQAQTYARQRNNANEAYVKRMLNYFLESRWRRPVLDMLVSTFFPGEEEALADALYMSHDQIRALQQAGMIVGSHGVHHPVMSHLDEEEQRQEICESFRMLEEVLETMPLRTFCYPYGRPHTFTRVTERLLDECGCVLSFAVDERDITAEDLRHRPQALPRYDCNQFPHGQCRTLS